MKRLILQELKNWVTSSIRKPLLMRGARQVGKTYVVRELGKQFDSFLEANFERTPELKGIFEGNLDPKPICEKLSLIFDQKIIPGKTLLFLDEIQICPRAIIALRYFYEEMPELHVIAAGSLLEFAIEKVGVPVGRISFCYMYPVSFIEFLLATGNDLYAQEILRHPASEDFNPVLHEKGLKILGEYMLVGGMPEAVAHWITKRDIASCHEIHLAILNTYRQDFEKYAKKTQLKYLELLFDRIPALICEPFKFSHISHDYQKRELAPCLDLLVKAGVVHKVLANRANGVPLGADANPDKFKLIFLDIALVQTILGLNPKDWILDPAQALNSINKGKIAEAFVGQELLAYSNSASPSALYYWHHIKPGSIAEVDYVVSMQREIIPIEVKSNKGTTLKSMHLFLKSKHHSKFGWRFSALNYSVFENIHSYPLYAVAGAINVTNPNSVETI